MAVFLLFGLIVQCLAQPSTRVGSVVPCQRPDFDVDYVVVGGGSGGSLVAGRLAESGANVLMLEAGPPSQAVLGGTDWQPPLNLTVFDIPMEWQRIVSDQPFKGRYEWPYTEKSGADLQLGRVLGGCGAHNAMIYVRGTPGDFDGWPEGWHWEAVLPYYKRYESNQDFADELHNNSGPISVSLAGYKDFPWKTSEGWLRALEARNVTRVEDLNGLSAMDSGRAGDHFTGIAGRFQFLIDRGLRTGSAAAFLASHPVRGRLTVMTGALATRIVIEGSSARGVEFTCGAGENYTIEAGREIVVSAGAVNSPKLLLLSGIGPKEHLEELGLPVHADLPVGLGLQDAVGSIMAWTYDGGHFERCNLPPKPNETDWCRTQLELFQGNTSVRESSAFSTAGISAGAFMNSPYQVLSDVQLTLWPYAKPAVSAAVKVTGQNEATLEIANLRPKSTGSVRLNSSDPHAPPEVDVGYLSEESDALPIVWAIKQARAVAEGLFVDELLPGKEFESDEDILRYIRCGVGATCSRSNLAVQHLVGTCALGRVVDSELRVQGVQRLRVADASVLPWLPSGNCHASVLMVAERAAALILGAAEAEAQAEPEAEVVYV